MNRLVSLHAGGKRELWQSIGLSFTDHSCLLADVELVLQDGDPQLSGWTFTGHSASRTAIDGIATSVVDVAPPTSHHSSIGAQKIVGVDHVVVTTDNLDRTCTAIESVLQVPVRREREVGNGVFQRFHKLDNTIIEVVSGPHVKHTGSVLWGLVVSVDDLFDLAETLGDSITSPPKKAVQPGRYISTIRASVGLGVAVAMMTPHVPGMPTQ